MPPDYLSIIDGAKIALRIVATSKASDDDKHKVAEAFQFLLSVVDKEYAKAQYSEIKPKRAGRS